MKHNAKSRLFAFVMTICILLSGLPFSVTATTDEEIPQLTNDEVAVADIPAESLSTNAIGITIDYSQIEVVVGSNKKLTASTNPAGQVVSWQSSNNNIATVSTSGLVRGISVGTTTILAMFMASDRNMYVAECTVHVRLANGDYFLQNKQTGYFADIKGPTMASGTTIHQWRFNLNDSQKWKFTHLGNGYYSIKSVNPSSTAYYLGVIHDSGNLNEDIVLRSGSLYDGMKWKIEPTANGAFKLIPKTGVSKGYVLATTTSSATNGAKLIQGAYVDNNSYRDEWYIHSVSEYVFRTELVNFHYDNVIDADAFWSDYWIQFHYDTAVERIKTDFYVDFEIENIWYSSLLNLSSSCKPDPELEVCTASCAPVSSCSSRHHRSGYRLNDLLQSSLYTCRMVSYTLCCIDNGEHIPIDGAGDVGGKNSSVSTDTITGLQILIRHELSHNLGAVHDTCIETEACALQNEEGGWCQSCEATIENTIKNSGGNV